MADISPIFKKDDKKDNKMTITVLKTTFQKLSPTLINYRNYSKFDIDNFKLELSNDLLINCDLHNITYEKFMEVFLNVLNIHAPLKTKCLRANNVPFMNKNLRKHIMTRSRFKNNLNKDPSIENKIAYNKQRNLCVNLSRKAKREYYSTLNPSIVADNRKFWSAIKPLFF